MFFALLLAACNGQPTTPAPTLRGAFVPTRIATNTATASRTPDPTATETPSPTTTETASPTATQTATMTPAPTETPLPTETPTPTASATAEPELLRTEQLLERTRRLLTPALIAELVERFREQTERQPGAGQAFIIRGLNLLQNNDLPQAKASFERALQLNPESLAARAGLLRIALADERFEDALVQLDAILADDADLPQAHLLRGAVLLEQGDFEAAITAFDTSLNLGGPETPGLLGRSLAQLGLEQPQAALTDLRAITLQSNSENAAEISDIIADLVQLISTDLALTPEAPSETQESLILIEGIDDFTFTGRIEGEIAEQRLQFEAEAGETIGIRMQRQSGNLDPFLQLEDAEGNTLADNDDDPQGTTTDAYLRDFRIPQTGSYIIVATRFQQSLGSTEGDYELVLERQLTPAQAEDPVIRYGESFTGEINNLEPALIIEFDGQAGDVIGIEMLNTGGSLDPLIVLLNAEGNRIALNDDDPQGSGRDAYLRDFSLPQSGRYQIVATRFQEQLGTTEGNFTLRLEQIVRSS